MATMNFTPAPVQAHQEVMPPEMLQPIQNHLEELDQLEQDLASE